MSEQAFGPEQDAEVLITPIRRRPRSRKSVYSRPVNYSRVILTVLFLAVLASGAAYYVYANYVIVNAPYAISLEGRVLAVLRTQDDAIHALRLYRAEYAPKAPGVVTFIEGEPLIRPYGKVSEVVAPDKAAEQLKQHLTPMYDGYALFVNRMPLALLATKEEALQTISLMLERGLKGKPGIPTFRQRVTVDHLRLELEEGKTLIILSPRETAAELVRSPRPRVHIVELGDNFWKIATANGITVDDLKALNPGVDYRRLHKGDRVKLPDSPSPVTVVVRAPARPRRPAAAPPPAAPTATPEPANSDASAENRVPATDDRTVAEPPAPGTEPGARLAPESTPPIERRPSAPPSAPSVSPRAPAPAPPRPSVNPRARAPEIERSPAPAPPPARRQSPPAVRPENPSPPPAAPSESVNTPKSYNDGRMPLKEKSTPANGD
jgi:LysM repeat protein